MEETIVSNQTTATTATTRTARKKAPKPKPAPVQLERVRLQRDHTHLGAKHPAGAEIDVHPDTAAWLRAVDVVAKAKA